MGVRHAETLDGVAFETGKTEVDGVETVFIEEWLRMTDDDVEWSADVCDREARIEVGNYAIEIKDARPVTQQPAASGPAPQTPPAPAAR